MKMVGVCLALLWAAPTSGAQVAGRLAGSVVDPNGDSVAGASITLRQDGGTVPVLATVSTSQGLFVLPDVRPDYYELNVIAPGFRAYRLRSVKVDPVRETSLPAITLTIE